LSGELRAATASTGKGFEGLKIEVQMVGSCKIHRAASKIVSIVYGSEGE